MFGSIEKTITSHVRTLQQCTIATGPSKPVVKGMTPNEEVNGTSVLQWTHYKQKIDQTLQGKKPCPEFFFSKNRQ